VDVVGQPEAAGLGEGLRVFLAQERAPHAAAAAAAEWAVAIDAGEHLVEHRVEEHGLEIGRGRARLSLEVEDRLAPRRRQRAERGRPGLGGELGDRGHHITSISAWMAPAALIACRMAIMSSGPMPSALSPSTSCCSDTPSLTSASFLPSSCTPMRVRGTTLVWPAENGLGWLTCA